MVVLLLGDPGGVKTLSEHEQFDVGAARVGLRELCDGFVSGAGN